MNEEEIIKEIFDIIGRYDGRGETDECIGEIKDYLEENNNIEDFKVDVDIDVYSSCGLDIYYIMIAWNDKAGLHLCGSKLTSY